MAQAERTLSYISLHFRFVDRESDVQKGSFAELETCLSREKRLEKNHLSCSAFFWRQGYRKYARLVRLGKIEKGVEFSCIVFVF